MGNLRLLDNNELHNDQLLFNQIADGDETAFRILFERYKRKFYRAAYRMSGSHYLSEEVVQETFIRVWSKRTFFRELESPVGYLHTLFYRQLSQRYQKDAAERQLSGEVIEMPYRDDLNAEDIELLKRRYQQLEKAVMQLPLQQARVFYLVKEKGLSREEAARQLHVSPNTVRNHLARAIKALRKTARTVQVVL